VLLEPGTYRLTAHVALDADLTEDQLVRLFVRLREAGVSLPAPAVKPLPEHPRLSPEEEAHKARRRAHVQVLVSEYEQLLGPGPETLPDALGGWLDEFELEVIRDAMENVARMRYGSQGTKYAHLKEELRKVRLGRERGVPPVPRGGGER
jgi:hypothetical protein